MKYKKYKLSKFFLFFFLLGGVTLVIFMTKAKRPASKPQFSRSIFGNSYQAEIANLNLNANLGVGREGAKIAVSRKDSQLEMTIPLSKATINKENEGLVYRVPEEVVEVRYQLLDNGLKEDVILNKKPGNHEFPVELKTENLVVKTTSEGIPVFFDSKTGQYQFHFQKPFAKDAKGNATYGVKYQITEKKLPQEILSPINQVLGENSAQRRQKKLLGELVTVPKSQSGIFVLTITVDENWLFDQERAFPVIIDPTVIYDTSTEFAQGTLNRITDTGSPSLESYYQEIPSDNHIVGLWHLNEAFPTTATDSSGNGNNGTPDGTSVISGMLGYARNFNGYSYITITDDTDFDIEDKGFTYSAWIKGNDYVSQTFNMIMGHHLPYFNVRSTGILHMSMTAAGAQRSVYGITPLQTDTWYHVAATYDSGGFMRVYLNGVEDGIAGPFVGVTNYDYPMRIGTWTNDLSYKFNGIIDEVVVYKRALSPEEIKAQAQRRSSAVYTSDAIDLAATGVAAWNSLSWTELGVATGDGETLAVGSTGNLVAQWNFNDTSGGTATNNAGSCGSTCNGSLTGFTNTTGQDVVVGSGWTANNKRWGAGALMLDGTNDYVSFGTALNSITAPPLTAEAWVKIDSQNGTPMIVQQNESATNYYGFRFGIVGTYQVDISYGSGGLIGAVSRRSKASVANAIAPGQWYHLVGVIRGETDMSIYVNGVDVGGTYSGSGGAMSVSGNGSIGRAIFASTFYLDGTIDSVRIYSRALSASEVLANYNAGNIEMQTRVGNSADPNDGTWEAWRPTTGESQILSMDSDSASWTWDNVIGSTPKYTGNESNIKTEGTGSLLLKTGYHTNAALVLLHLEETSCTAGRCLYNASGDGYDGAPTGELVVVDGFYGKARYFDGNQDFIDVGTSYHPANVTIEAWVKPNAVNGAKHTIITQQRGTTGPSGAHWTLSISSANKFQFATYNGSWVEANGSTTPQVGQWYHVAGSYDGANLRLFVNGALEAITGLGTGISYVGERGVKVGAGETLAGFEAAEFFIGVIDEVRVHNTALIQINTQEIYKAGRDHRLSRTIPSTDLSSKTKIPFWVAADRQGTFMEVGIGESAYANYSADANTVGLWHLDDGAGLGGTGPTVAGFFKDDSGNAKDGTDTGGTTFTQGKIGKARYFDGVNDYINIGATGTYNRSAYSISFWTKAASNIEDKRVFSEGNSSNDTPLFALGTGLTASSTNSKLRVFIRSNDGVGRLDVMTNAPVFNDQWNHVVYTDNNGSYKVYVNGALDISGTYTRAATTINKATIGAVGRVAYTYYFNGTIDEFREDSVIRTADEIRQAYEVDKRSHQITIDFKAELSSGNLITGSGDYSFTIDSTQYGAQRKGDNLYAGDKVIVKEIKTDGNEYLAQGTVTSVTPSTGAVTVNAVDGWDTGSTFPAGGYTVNATVFKWQREYFDITSSLSTHRNAITRLTLRITDGSQGASVWLDDFRSVGNYLTTPTGSTITSSLGKRYFQYRAIFSSNDPAVSASLTSLTLDYDDLNAPTGCLLEEHRQDSQIIVKWNDTNTVETGYQIQKNTDGAGFSDLTTTAADATSYTDGAVSGNHTYQYRARAEKTGVYSDWCYFSQLNLGEGSFKFEGVKMEGVRID